MRPDRGQATILVAGALALVFALLMGLGALAGHVVDRGAAQAAADAVALAAAHDPTRARELAGRVATSNAATLVSIEVSGTEVTVVVDVDGETATARASAAR